MQKMRITACLLTLCLLCTIGPGLPASPDATIADTLSIRHVKAPNGVFTMKNGVLKLQGGSLHLKVRLIDRSVIEHAVARTIQNIQELLKSSESTRSLNSTIKLDDIQNMLLGYNNDITTRYQIIFNSLGHVLKFFSDNVVYNLLGNRTIEEFHSDFNFMPNDVDIAPLPSYRPKRGFLTSAARHYMPYSVSPQKHSWY